MLKNKILLLSLIFSMACLSVKAEEFADLNYPKPPFYRVGISELPEKQYIQAQQKKTKVQKTYAKIDDSLEADVMDLTYADLSIKRLSKEVAQELEFEEQDMIADLSLLWQGAAMQSDTINFALYKLANPDADKPDSKSVKKVLTTIASMSTLVGASMANPIFAGSSLIGGNILNIMSQDTKALNYKYTRVTDADMIILIRKIEDLQQNAVNLYYDYMSAKKQLEMTNKLVEDRQRKFELAQKNNAQRELVVITDAYFRTALDKQRTAKSDFFSKRAALEQFVGNETFVQFEAELAARERGEKPKPVQKVEEQPKDNEPTYAQTIENVENYTNSLKDTNNKHSEAKSDETQQADSDKNLDKMPELKPIEMENTSDSAENVDSNVESQKDKADKSSAKLKLKDKFKHSNTSETPKLKEKNTKIKEVKQVKSEEKKTKEIKFFKQKENKKVEEKLLPLESIDGDSVSSDKSEKEVKLAPLDEIKAPDINNGSYSIYSEDN